MKYKNGFSLIEIMIVVAIIGILAAIAYPSYTDYVTRSKRSDGQAALVNLSNLMEKYYSEHNTYQTATVGASVPATDLAPTNVSPDGHYTLSIPAQTASTYTLQATPINAQGTADTRCQSLTINNLGVKGVTNGPAGAPTGVAADCW